MGVIRMNKRPLTGNSALPPQPPEKPPLLERWAKLPPGALAKAIAENDAKDQAFLKAARAEAAKAGMTPK